MSTGNYRQQLELMSTADLEKAIAAGLRKHSSGAIELMKQELQGRNREAGAGTPSLFPENAQRSTLNVQHSITEEAQGAPGNYWQRLRGGQPA